MEVQTVNLSNARLIPSGSTRDGIRLKRSGVAKVLWRKLDIEVPPTTILPNGLNML